MLFNLHEHTLPILAQPAAQGLLERGLNTTVSLHNFSVNHKAVTGLQQNKLTKLTYLSHKQKTVFMTSILMLMTTDNKPQRLLKAALYPSRMLTPTLLQSLLQHLCDVYQVCRICLQNNIFCGGTVTGKRCFGFQCQIHGDQWCHLVLQGS